MRQFATIALAFICFLFNSCNDEKKATEAIDGIADAPELVETGTTFSTYEEFIPAAVTDTVTRPFVTKGKKPEPFVNEQLPKTYTDRTFIRNLAGSTYDLFLVPGNIVKFDTAKKDYERKTLIALIKRNKTPSIEIIQDGIIYSNKINKGANFNGSFVIGSIAVSDKQIMELIVQDVTKSYVPDSLIDVALVKKLADKIPAAERKYYYYVKNAVLTLINNRKFRESTIETKINTTYVTAEGKAYNSNDKFARDRVVSVELVSLDGLITPLASK